MWAGLSNGLPGTAIGRETGIMARLTLFTELLAFYHPRMGVMKRGSSLSSSSRGRRSVVMLGSTLFILVLVGSGIITGASGTVILPGIPPPVDNGTMVDASTLCFFPEKGERPINHCDRVSIPELARRWHRSDATGDTGCLMVIGHASDGSGPYGDDRLSMKRAQVVASRLRALGIPDTVFVGVYGIGSRHPLIPDSPHDIQNRFVEIFWRHTSQCE